MSESETYKELGELTKCKDRWEGSIPYVASENIATNTPAPYQEHMSVFAKLQQDGDDKVRMEAPEIFRVLGFRVRVRDFRPPRHRRAFLVS